METIITKEYENVRLDKFLRKNCKNDSLSSIFSAIRTGKVKVNSKKVKQDYRLKCNDKLSIVELDFNLNEKVMKNYNKDYIGVASLRAFL